MFTGIAIHFLAQGKQLRPSMHAAGSTQNSVKESQVWTITVQISFTPEVTLAALNLKKYGLRKKFQTKAPNSAEWNGTANIPVPDSTTNAH